MSVQSTAADAFQVRAITRSDAATVKALKLWRQVPVADLDAGWAVVGPQIVLVASQAVVRDADDAARTTAVIAKADRMPAGDVLNPYAFSGVDGSGRDVEGLLHGAVTTTKTAVGAGMGLAEAFLSGGSYLAAMMKTALADVSRSSQMAAATGRTYTRYIRVVNAGACSRCAILAGSDRFSTRFKRHPSCRCDTLPVKDLSDLPGGTFSSPGEYFDSLSAAEQNRIFTKDGAEAIRLGADPIQVVGARRGARGIGYSRSLRGAKLTDGRAVMTRSRIGTNADGSPILGYTTTESTTRRGSFRGVSRARLMPETIMELSGDVDVRRMLLRDAGYLRGATATDRAAALEFYISRGIRAI